MVALWQLGALGVALAVNAVVFYGIVWLAGKRPEIDAAPGVGVTCEVCGTVNDAGYRYCSSCTTDLSTAVRTAGDRADGHERAPR